MARKAKKERKEFSTDNEDELDAEGGMVRIVRLTMPIKNYTGTISGFRFKNSVSIARVHTVGDYAAFNALRNNYPQIKVEHLGLSEPTIVTRAQTARKKVLPTRTEQVDTELQRMLSDAARENLKNEVTKED